METMTFLLRLPVSLSLYSKALESALGPARMLDPSSGVVAGSDRAVTLCVPCEVADHVAQEMGEVASHV